MIAVLLIRQGAVTDVMDGYKDCKFGQASKQQARFQEEVEELTDKFLKAQADRRRVHKQELRKNMLKVSNQMVAGNQISSFIT